MKRTHIIIAIVLVVLILDQALKIWVKTNMYIGEDSFLHWADWTIRWGRLHFVENNGMAFGIELGNQYGKLILSLFRIVAVGFLIYFIRRLIEAKASMGLLISFALILAGAIGNILDSAFYGLMFSASEYHSRDVAEMFPEAGGYASFLHGKVVDMFYFPFIENGRFPSWFPFWGGEPFEFFKPVFNIADVSISTGVISILLFQRSFFSSNILEDEDIPNAVEESDSTNGEIESISSDEVIVENKTITDDKSLPEE